MAICLHCLGCVLPAAAALPRLYCYPGPVNPAHDQRVQCDGLRTNSLTQQKVVSPLLLAWGKNSVELAVSPCRCWDPFSLTQSTAVAVMAADLLVYVPADKDDVQQLLTLTTSTLESAVEAATVPAWPAAATSASPLAQVC